MISLDNAKRLEELGVSPYWQTCGLDKFIMLNSVDGDLIYPLFQLLEEVEKRGLAWELCDITVYSEEDGYEISLYEKAGKIFTPHEERCRFIFQADTPEDSVALALIEILRRENEED